MKTPDEIKRGLGYCNMHQCPLLKCPYFNEAYCGETLNTDALAYIQQLEAEKWDLFDLLSSAWYGKGCYFKQDDGTVYSNAA